MSDALWWVLQPSGLLLTLLAFAWVLLIAGARRFARGIVGLVLLAWGGAVLLPVDAWLAAPLEARTGVPDPMPGDVDGILVLGGAVEWRVSEARQQLALGDAGERMLAAAALARRFPDATLAFTGVSADALAQDFRAEPTGRSLVFGPEFAGRDMIVLSEASSTYEDAMLALRRIAPQPGDTWLLVTSAWHMPRAWATFRTLGWTMVPYPVDYRAGGRTRGQGWLPRTLPPPAARLAELDTMVREWGAVAIYRRTGRITDEAWRAVPPPGLQPTGGPRFGARP